MKKNGINTTSASLLGLLHEAPMSCAELNKFAQKWMSPYLSVTRSQIYRELPAMFDRGYVALWKVGPRSEQTYKITASGKRAFQRWLNEIPNEDQIRNQVALRIAFSNFYKDDAQLVGMIEWAKNYHKLALDAAKLLSADANKEGMHLGVAALKFSIGYHRAALTWLNNIDLEG